MFEVLKFKLYRFLDLIEAKDKEGLINFVKENNDITVEQVYSFLESVKDERLKNNTQVILKVFSLIWYFVNYHESIRFTEEMLFLLDRCLSEGNTGNVIFAE